MDKCEFPSGMDIKPDGVNSLDPCIYEEIERYENVTVCTLRCKRCGHTEVLWLKQPDTRKVETE